MTTMRMMLVVRRDGRLGDLWHVRPPAGKDADLGFVEGLAGERACSSSARPSTRNSQSSKAYSSGKPDSKVPAYPLEHSGKCVAVLDRGGNQPARLAPDEPVHFVDGVEN